MNNNDTGASMAKLGLLFVGWLGLFGMGQSDAPRDIHAQESSSLGDELQTARTRWAALPEAEKARLQRRFERVQKMDSSQREKLQKRSKHAKRMGKLRERVMAQLSDPDRERLMKQPLPRRRELIDELVEQERRDKGQRIESKLPERMRNWLRGASPKERRARLAKFKTDTRERISALAVEDLAKALGFDADDRKRLERLPMKKRMRTVMDLRKQLTAQQVAANGLPADFGAERWEALAVLPPEKFLPEVWRLQNRGVLRDVSVGKTHRREKPKDHNVSFRRSFFKAMKITASDRLGLSDLSPRERRGRLQDRRRGKVLELLREHGNLDEAELESLQSLANERFFPRVRKLAAEVYSPQ